MTQPSGAAPAGPGTARVVLLVARLSGRRLFNRLGISWGRRALTARRSASARKPSAGKLLLVFMVLLFAGQTVITASRLLQAVARRAEQRASPELAIVSRDAWDIIEHAAELEQTEPASEAVHAALELAFDLATRELPDPAARRAELRRLYDERGVSGFRLSVVPERALWPSSELWYAAGDPRWMIEPLAFIAWLLGLAQILQHVAAPEDELTRVGSGLEWWFSFPVPARALFLARALSAVFTPLTWVVLLPFYVVIFACALPAWLALPLGVAAASHVALLGGGLRVLLETSLRRHLSVAWLSRVQALLLTFSLVPLVGAYGLALSPRLGGLLSWVSELPEVSFYAPLGLPLWWSAGGAVAWLSALAALVFLGAWLALCVGVAERMVRAGVTSGGPERSARRAPVRIGAGRRARPLLGGVLLKEWRSLLRDRRLRAQAFLGPLLMLGLQLALNPSLVKGISSNPRHAATAAFAVAGFSLTTGATSSLAAEGPALWLLYTAPQRLERLLLRKLWAWGSVAGLFALSVLLVAWSQNPALLAPSLPHAALAFAGLYLYSVIALCLGALNTNVLEPEPRRRLRLGSVYLFMLLVSLFGYGIYTPAWSTKLVQLVLSSLLAFALWQKLRDRLPFLLDPTQAPAPAIDVADGVIVASGFFVLQSLFTPLLERVGVSPARALLVAFVCAGSSVALLALLHFQRGRVPRLAQALGFRRPAGQRIERLPAIGLGVLAGSAAGVFAVGYLALARHVPWLARSLEEARLSVDDLDLDARLSLLALSLLAAPLFEELIFRGILYRGFRRSTSAPLAALSSALVFALMHPGVTALPVFVMALLAGLTYERTGWLMTPIAAHTTYNALMVGSAFL